MLAAVVGTGAWWAWLGRDTSSYRDAAEPSAGPHTTGQVLGCALTVGLVTAVLSWRWRATLVAGGVTSGFWSWWTVGALARDDSGLRPVGSVLVLLGVGVGTALVGFLSRSLRGWRDR